MDRRSRDMLDSVGSASTSHYQHVGSHTDCPVERTREYGSVRPTTVGDLGKAHQIHAVVNNHQEEHRVDCA
jgi:hypothetical protein